MSTFRGVRTAFGWPGTEPRWTHGNKDGVGTARSTSSHIWFTLARGVLTEVYFPTVDRPQLRELQYLITDGETFCHQERDLESQVAPIARHVLGYQVNNADPKGRYRISKEIIAHPQLPCVLQHTRLESAMPLQLYATCEPRLGGGGWGNNGYVIEVHGRQVLVAEKGGLWLAMGATVPFSRLSCGYIGYSDGAEDLRDNYKLDWEFDQALEGNILLTGQLDLTSTREFTMGLAFGSGRQSAVTALLQALSMPYHKLRTKFVNQWDYHRERIHPLGDISHDNGALYHTSHSLLIAHQDKTYLGAMIASLSIPWGENLGDDGSGGYHLVWTRDMINSATGLLAAGDEATPLKALVYLAASQQADGGFPQNFWINGDAHWPGIQLDEVAFPILLAWRLKEAGALWDFDPYTLVMRAAAYLINHGPATQQERWEENSGYSPSTLAVNIAALICAAAFAYDRGDMTTATFLEGYADFLESHVDAWTVTTEGTLVPGIPRHYIRILPVDINDPSPNENPNQGILFVANRKPGTPQGFPAKDIVDAGFLELVRYGIRKPDDPLIVDSLKVVDAVLKAETPFGPAWRRYNHDGYGEQPDGKPYVGWGQGRAWPLLAGERGHYELAAGHDVTPFIRAMERFASPAGMLPEQVWDESDLPDADLRLGKPTGSAMPLMWAHAEYIKLLRSARDCLVFDLIEPVAQRYRYGRQALHQLEVWKLNRQPKDMRKDALLRVQAMVPFRLRWSEDDWLTIQDTNSTPTSLGIHFVDLKPNLERWSPIRFTFYWTGESRWEGRDYEVAIRH
ncbi:MAG TPA: glycoside hydrolase family 15 protein [Symbiobacteriaceae bacterium]|jgi:glucoamylase